MKRKIISYLLVGLLAVFIVGYCSVYVEAKGEAGINPDLMGDDGDGGGGGSVSGPKGNGVNPDLDGGENPNNTPPASDTPDKKDCPGIKLNTNFPIIGNCIGDDPDENEINAFPSMLGTLTKIVMSLILVVCFILVIVAGIMRAADKPDPAKKMLKRVAITIILLGLSGVILKLINPNFFY